LSGATPPVCASFGLIAMVMTFSPVGCRRSRRDIRGGPFETISVMRIRGERALIKINNVPEATHWAIKPIFPSRL